MAWDNCTEFTNFSNCGVNTSNGGTCEIIQSWAIVMITANVISTLVGGVGNSLVCIAVWKTASLHTAINYYMASLAVADLIVTVLCQPLMVGVIAGRLSGDLGCHSTLDKVYRAIGNFSCAASFFHLCCISLERLLAIVRPINTISGVHHKRFIFLASASWLIALIYSVLRVTVSRKGTSYFSAASFAIGYVWIILCYIIILVFLAIQAKRQAALTLSEKKHRKNEKKITVTMVLVIACFTTMWLPFFCFRLSSNPRLNSGFVYELAITMAFCNSSFNAIIYSFRNRKYRKAFKGFLFRNYRLVNRGTTGTTARTSSPSRKSSSNVLKPTTSFPMEDSPFNSRSKTSGTGSEGSLNVV
ncbi:trace amine-associated receptor 9-like [Dendronephthya gigantea]|uniref:trace amine-associated receptor 9-like n=1 Tax=Dendronephthya gigantea TaxID=151771 RepID=UPI00106CF867|nr:trace amine-associated receptor 9-like [Dendronephthya gigantea]